MGVPNTYHEFVEMVARMRSLQREYYKTKRSETLREAMAAESDIDNIIAVVRRGSPRSAQKSLFGPKESR